MFAVSSIDNGDEIISAIANPIQIFAGTDIYMWIMIALGCILAIIFIVVIIVYLAFPQWFSEILIILGVNKNDTTKGEEIDIDSLYKTIAKAGYAYDQNQDIFYSTMDAWQRKYGYCRLYDESAAPLGMIIDCEPIYFEYKDKKWLIEFWKGQYDMTCGGEIGVYSTDKDDLDIYDVFSGTFYNCVNNQDLLQISFVLKKNDEVLFTREDKHWWLTGFKLGEFCNPSELKMKLSITLKDRGMRNAFIKGLEEAGYPEEKLSINDNTVSLEFNEPRTTQPLTRKAKTDWIIQKKNKLLCDKYQEVTGSYDNFPDKMKAIQKEAPELFEVILKIGKTKDVFEKYKEIKDYLD